MLVCPRCSNENSETPKFCNECAAPLVEASVALALEERKVVSVLLCGREGLGGTREAITDSPPAPTVFARRGLRPGGLAPAETRTRFTWSLTSAAPRR